MIAIVTFSYREDSYIEEFVKYHKSIGVSQFYIYDTNNSIKNTDKSCKIIPFCNRNKLSAYKDFKKNILPLSKEDWFLFIDINEFIVPIKHKTLVNFIDDYGYIDTIAINTKLFSACGHVNKPEGSIFQNYTYSKFSPFIKTIVHRLKLENYEIHDTYNIIGSSNNINGYPINEKICNIDYTNIIQINNYTRSWSEFIEKIDIYNKIESDKIALFECYEDLFSYESIDDHKILSLINLNPFISDISQEIEDISKLYKGFMLPEVLMTLYNNKKHSKYFLECKIFKIDTSMVLPELTSYFTKLIRINNIQNVLQIGFNTGMVSSAILGAKAQLNLLSLDNIKNINNKSLEIINNIYPNRHILKQTDDILDLLEEKNDKIKYDLIFIDNESCTQKFIEYALLLLKTEGIIVINHYNTIKNDWIKAVEAKQIKEIDLYLYNEGWVVGYKV